MKCLDVVKEYLKNLKRLDDGERYFQSLTDEEYANLENTKEYRVWKDILNNCIVLYPLAKARGEKRLYYYEENKV